MRDAYRQILLEADMSGETAVFRNLRDRLFTKPVAEQAVKKLPRAQHRLRAGVLRWGGSGGRRGARGDRGGRSVRGGVPRHAHAAGTRRRVGRGAHPRTGSGDRDRLVHGLFGRRPGARWARIVPPEEKLSYLQKPFHPHEIRQMTISLASKWRAEHRIVKLAYFDALTGLPNREQSRNRLSSALAAAQQHERMLAVLYLDLDNFKRVNDTLGHAVGDELLCLVAARMRQSLRADEGAAADAQPSPRIESHRATGRR